MSGNYVGRLRALLGHLDEISRRTERAQLGTLRTERQNLADFVRQSVDPAELRADLRAALDELERCQTQLAETSADGAQWQSRAEKAEAELEQARAEVVQAREEGAARAALGTHPAIWCWNRHPDHPLPCTRFAGHEGPHVRGERRWEDAAPQQPECCGTCNRDFTLPYVTRHENGGTCTDCAETGVRQPEDGDRG